MIIRTADKELLELTIMFDLGGYLYLHDTKNNEYYQLEFFKNIPQLINLEGDAKNEFLNLIKHTTDKKKDH